MSIGSECGGSGEHRAFGEAALRAAGRVPSPVTVSVRPGLPPYPPSLPLPTGDADAFRVRVNCPGTLRIERYGPTHPRLATALALAGAQMTADGGVIVIRLED